MYALLFLNLIVKHKSDVANGNRLLQFFNCVVRNRGKDDNRKLSKPITYKRIIPLLMTYLWRHIAIDIILSGGLRLVGIVYSVENMKVYGKLRQLWRW